MTSSERLALINEIKQYKNAKFRHISELPNTTTLMCGAVATHLICDDETVIISYTDDSKENFIEICITDETQYTRHYSSYSGCIKYTFEHLISLEIETLGQPTAIQIR